MKLGSTLEVSVCAGVHDFAGEGHGLYEADELPVLGG